jgi:hypothetical protein
MTEKQDNKTPLVGFALPAFLVESIDAFLESGERYDFQSENSYATDSNYTLLRKRFGEEFQYLDISQVHFIRYLITRYGADEYKTAESETIAFEARDKMDRRKIGVKKLTLRSKHPYFTDDHFSPLKMLVQGMIYEYIPIIGYDDQYKSEDEFFNYDFD